MEHCCGRALHGCHNQLSCVQFQAIAFFLSCFLLFIVFENDYLWFDYHFICSCTLLYSCRIFRSMFYEANQSTKNSSGLRRNKTVLASKPPTPITPRRLSSTPTGPQKKGLKLRKGSILDISAPEGTPVKKEKQISESVS